jgi:hypothetical protein
MMNRNVNGTRDPTVTFALDGGSHINAGHQPRAKRVGCMPWFGTHVCA